MGWKQNRVTEMLGIEYPILLGPMAGVTSTPQLVAAVSNAGGLGSYGGGYLTPEQLRQAIREIRALTDRPFAVNLFVMEEVEVDPEQVAQVNQLMQKYRDELGIGEAPQMTRYAESYEAQLAVVLEERVPVFSFTFGIPSPEQIAALKANGTILIGTATTVREGVELEQAGVDLIVGQGSEAGAHRGTFLSAHSASMIGTVALIPSLTDYVSVPVIAAGGIMDGRGVAAAFALGAEGALLGTAFLTSKESGASTKHKEAVLNATEESTTLTRAFSGKYARGIRNRFLNEMEPHEALIPEYPIQNALTRDIRKAAAEQYKPGYLSLWAGQGTRLAQSKPASEIFAQVVEQTEAVLERLQRS
ncbi:MAG: NAD(P)H-dependent flavin oxidoreductase [Tumebacillaceae bacterium]